METKKTLVIGASENPTRYSYMAVEKLKLHGHPVLALGRKSGKIGDTTILDSTPNEKVHTVTLYVNPVHQADYQEYILNLNPHRVIFNPGTENPDFAKKLEENGIEALEACTLVLLSTNQF